MQTTEIIIREDGTLTERVIHERELDAGTAVLDALTEEVTRTARNVLSLIEWGPVHAQIGNRDIVWTAAIRRIPLHTRYRLIEGVMVPVFASTTDIELPLVWHAPPEVRLAFVVRTEVTETGALVRGNWLFALDTGQRGYRLPLSNLHEDCQICTGGFPDRHASAVECVIASLEQFRKSRWNADLMRTVERSQKFFRFHPTDETFETLPIAAADWTSLCDKVATDILERVVL